MYPCIHSMLANIASGALDVSHADVALALVGKPVLPLLCYTDACGVQRIARLYTTTCKKYGSSVVRERVE